MSNLLGDVDWRVFAPQFIKHVFHIPISGEAKLYSTREVAGRTFPRVVGNGKNDKTLTINK